MTKPIEIYEWKEGAPRPGTTEKARETCIDWLDVPSDGQAPQAGDIVWINENPNDVMRVSKFRVIDREMIWVRTPDLHAQDAATWVKMCLNVRRVEDDTK